MKLWLLRPQEKYERVSLGGNDDASNPWEPWFDKAFGFVVRAETEERARQLASEDAGDENEGSWLSPEFSSCVELSVTGLETVIIRDFASA